MKYLVTGGSGFCGFEICRLLAQKGYPVRNLDLEPMPGALENVEWLQGDLCDPDTARHAMQGIEKVIHCAAKVPISKSSAGFRKVNIEGTRTILQAAKDAGVTKVVHLSSSAVQLGERNPVPEDAPLHPIDPYGQSKAEGERVCREFRAAGLPVDIVRPRTVIGTGRLGIFDIFFEWIAEGRKIYIIGQGNNKIQFLHAGDLAEVCCRASQNPEAHDYNVGSRSFGTLREDLGALIRHAGTGARLAPLPVALTIGLLRVLDWLRLSPLAPWHYLSYHRDFYFDNRQAKRILNWEPRLGNQEILKIAYDDYLRHRNDPARRTGTSHRKGLKQGVLKFLKMMS